MMNLASIDFIPVEVDGHENDAEKSTSIMRNNPLMQDRAISVHTGRKKKKRNMINTMVCIKIRGEYHLNHLCRQSLTVRDTDHPPPIPFFSANVP